MDGFIEAHTRVRLNFALEHQLIGKTDIIKIFNAALSILFTSC
jgi:hypothetical protein